MTTRLYFKVSATAGASPAFDAGWGFTSEAQRRRTSTGQLDSATAAGTLIGPWTANTTTYALDRQYVSDPLASDFTISGTVSGALRVLEGQAADNVDQLICCIRVVSENGSTVRGTLLALGSYGATTEFLTSYRTRIFANGTPLSAVNALAGDRIVIELGYRSSGGSGSPTSPEARAVWGAVPELNDLPLDDADASDLNPWIEFSQDIPLEPGAARVQVVQGEVVRAVPNLVGAARIDTALIEVVRSVVTPLATRKTVRLVSISVD